MKRRSSRFDGLGFSSVSAENNVSLMARSAAARGVQRVDDVIGLAEPERQSDHEVGSDIADDVFRDRVGVGKQLWHRDADPARN